VSPVSAMRSGGFGLSLVNGHKRSRSRTTGRMESGGHHIVIKHLWLRVSRDTKRMAVHASQSRVDLAPDGNSYGNAAPARLSGRYPSPETWKQSASVQTRSAPAGG